MKQVGSQRATCWVAGTLILELAAMALTACGADGVTVSQASGAGSGSIERASAGDVEIEGAPVTAVGANQTYSFQPLVTTTTNTAGLKFSIANLPSWAKFDNTTGELSGTPNETQIGQYAGIAISVTHNGSTATLPAFSIDVGEGNSPGTVTLSWEPPTQNSDGTPLVDLKGYKIHYGQESRAYSGSVELHAGMTTYVVQNLDAGTYYFAVSTLNSAGAESSMSQEISTQVD